MKKKTATAYYIARAEKNPAKPMPTRTAGISRKLTTSLFPADMEALEAVYALIREHGGIHPSRSDAIKLGLRLAAESTDGEAVRRHIAAIKREDGRNRAKE